jgi:hypothetical protein
LPFVKEWLEEHPMGNASDTHIFISQGNNRGSKLTLDDYYNSKYFSKLLDDDTVSESDCKSFRL